MTILTTEHNSIITDKLAEITAEVVTINAELSTLEKPSAEDVANYDRLFELLCSGAVKDMSEDEIKAWRAEFGTFGYVLHYNSLDIKLKNFEQTIADQERLCYCPCKFLLTDGHLLSPAGFNYEDRVFLANDIMIHSDRQPTKAVGNATQVYDIDKTCAKEIAA